MATQNLLKVDATRVRKATAAQSRKDAAAPMQKAPGRVRDWAAPMRKQRTSGVAAHVPEQRASSGAAHVGAYGADGFFGNSGRSPIQPWMYQSSDPSTW